ncbi:MAG: Short C-terminal domain [Eubacteriales bacterium]|nr:Short C-terminal domain [Eubacteriales bacterium]
MMHWWWDKSWAAWGPGFKYMGVAMLVSGLFWILLLVVLVLLVRKLYQGQRDGKKQALTILQERLARGEITPEEYLERKKVLEEEK